MIQKTGGRTFVLLTAVAFALAWTFAAAAGTIRYTYDAAGRLIKVRYDDQKQIIYTYDAMGNILRRTVGDVPPPLPGDCDGDESVSEAEAQSALDMALGTVPPACRVDADGNGTVSVGEAQRVVVAYLGEGGIRVTVSPAYPSVAPGGSVAFSAVVTGTSDAAVSWSIVEGAAGGAITEGGLYTAPEAPGVYHVVAASHADPSKTGSAAVSVSAGDPFRPSISIGSAQGLGGEAVQVPLALSGNGFAVAAVLAQVSYDSAFLMLQGAALGSSGSAAGKTLRTRDLRGGIALEIAGLNGAVIGDGPLAVLTFQIQGSAPGTTPVQGSADSCDPGGIDLSTGVTPGSVTYPECAVTCSASADPVQGKAPLTVQFAGEAQATYCTGATIFSWTFGDGGTSTEQSATHEYAAAGTFTWTLTVTADGKTCARSGTVTVQPAIPGDGDGDGVVSIGEVQQVINMFLGNQVPGNGADCDGDGVISIGEVQRVISAFLGLTASC